MPPNAAACYALQRGFRDFDQLADEARHWNLDLLQLDCGPFQGDVLQFGIGRVHISEARFDRTFAQRGAPPSGLRTIAVPADRNVRFVWRGEQVTGQDLVIFPEAAELSSRSNPDFHVYTCSFPEELLGALAESLRLDTLDELRGSASVVRCRPSVMDSVQRFLAQLCALVRGSTGPLDEPVFAKRTTGELPGRLLSALASALGSQATPTTRKRELALTLAEAFIERFSREDITVRDICRVAQVSQRTLEYAFVERFGVTPKAFLKAHRLNGVRRALRAADPRQCKVADIANQWGIWHLGQFAADYRAKFDELPSQTLRRVAVAE